MTNHKSIVLITGANKGIGFEVAKQLKHADRHILVGARDQQRGEEATRQLVELGVSASFLPIDITDDASIENASAMVSSDFGQLDVLINNACLLYTSDAADES